MPLNQRYQAQSQVKGRTSITTRGHRMARVKLSTNFQSSEDSVACFNGIKRHRISPIITNATQGYVNDKAHKRVPVPCVF